MALLKRKGRRKGPDKGPFFAPTVIQLPDHAMADGLPGLTTKKALIVGSSSLSSSASVNWKRFSCGALTVTIFRS